MSVIIWATTHSSWLAYLHFLLNLSLSDRKICSALLSSGLYSESIKTSNPFCRMSSLVVKLVWILTLSITGIVYLRYSFQKNFFIIRSSSSKNLITCSDLVNYFLNMKSYFPLNTRANMMLILVQGSHSSDASSPFICQDQAIIVVREIAFSFM